MHVPEGGQFACVSTAEVVADGLFVAGPSANAVRASDNNPNSAKMIDVSRIILRAAIESSFGTGFSRKRWCRHTPRMGALTVARNLTTARQLAAIVAHAAW
jgi:hypothetical protein